MGGAFCGDEAEHRSGGRPCSLTHPRGEGITRFVRHIGPGLAHAQVSEADQQGAEAQVVGSEAENVCGEGPENVVARDPLGRAAGVAARGQPVEQLAGQPRVGVAEPVIEVAAAEQSRNGGPGVQRLDALAAEPAHQCVPEVVGGAVSQDDRVRVGGQVHQEFSDGQRRQTPAHTDVGSVHAHHRWPVVARVGGEGQDARGGGLADQLARVGLDDARVRGRCSAARTDGSVGHSTRQVMRTRLPRSAPIACWISS